jgi:hypothetical protein
MTHRNDLSRDLSCDNNHMCRRLDRRISRGTPIETNKVGAPTQQLSSHMLVKTEGHVMVIQL